MAITETITKIQFRRGTTLEREPVVLSPGEPGWDIQQKILYIGDSNKPGGVPCIKFNPSDFDLTNSDGVSLNYNGLDYDTIIQHIRDNGNVIAKKDRLGVVKVGDGLSIDEDGKLDVTLNGKVTDGNLSTATYNDTGIVSIREGSGIEVDSMGSIGVKQSELDFSKTTYGPGTPVSSREGDTWYNSSVSTPGWGALYIRSPKPEWEPIFYITRNMTTPIDDVSEEKIIPTQRAILEYIESELKKAVPTGTVHPYAGAVAPVGWLLCYGQDVEINAYKELYNAIGKQYGTPSSNSTFKLPDLRGRVVAGKDDMGNTSANRLTGRSGGVNGDILGRVGGHETHKLTASQIPKHKHLLIPRETYYAPTSWDEYGNYIGPTMWAGKLGQEAGKRSQPSYSFKTDKMPYVETQDDGLDDTLGEQPHNNVQPTIILNYIIKT